MVREMLIGIRRDGIPASGVRVRLYVAVRGHGAGMTCPARWTMQMLLRLCGNSDWDESVGMPVEPPIRTQPKRVAQDLADNTIEVLTVPETPRPVRPCSTGSGVLGVERVDNMWDCRIMRSKVFKGRDLIFVHNHPNGSDASDDDLRQRI